MFAFNNNNNNNNNNSNSNLPSSLAFANRSSTLITSRKVKQKLTPNSVSGKIIVYSAQDGSTKIGQWGGTECFLSIQPHLGPCLVVRSSRHKRHEGNFFQLCYLKEILSSHVLEGKLTVVIGHQRQLCSVFIETSTDVNELRVMAATLQDRRSWKMIERNVACKQGKGNGAYTVTTTTTSNSNNNSSSSNMYASGRLRDPMLAQLQNEQEYSDDSDMESDKDNEYRNQIVECESDMETNIKNVIDERNESMLELNNGNVIDQENNNIENQVTIHNNNNNNNNIISKDCNDSNTNVIRNDLSTVQIEHIKFCFSEMAQKALHYVKKNRNVFITTPATSHLNIDSINCNAVNITNVLHSKLRNKRILITSPLPTSVASCNIFNVYSLLCIQANKMEYKLNRVLHKIKKDVDKCRLWSSCDVCIVDHVHLLPANVFTLLCQVASAFHSTITRGNKETNKNTNDDDEEEDNGNNCVNLLQWIVLGDFLQLPPEQCLSSKSAYRRSNTQEQQQQQEEQQQLYEGEKQEQIQDEHDWAFNSDEWDKCNFAHVHFNLFTNNDSNDNNKEEDEISLARCAEHVRQGNWTGAVEETISSIMCHTRNSLHALNVNEVNTENYKPHIEPVEVFISRDEANKYNLARLAAAIDKENSINNNSNNNSNNNNSKKNTRLFHYESDDYAAIPGTNIDENVVLLPYLSLRVGAQVVLLHDYSYNRNNNNDNNYNILHKGDVGVIIRFTTNNNTRNNFEININNDSTDGDDEMLPIVYFSRINLEIVISRILLEIRCGFDEDDKDNDNANDNDGNEYSNNNKHLFMSRRQLPLSLGWGLSVYDMLQLKLPKLHLTLNVASNTHYTISVAKEEIVYGMLYILLTSVLHANDFTITLVNDTTTNNNINSNNNHLKEQLLDSTLVIKQLVTLCSTSECALAYYAKHFPQYYSCIENVCDRNKDDHENNNKVSNRENMCDSNNIKQMKRRKRSRGNEAESCKTINLERDLYADSEHALDSIPVNMPISDTIPLFTQDSQLIDATHDSNVTTNTQIKGLLLDDDDEEDVNS